MLKKIFYIILLSVVSGIACAANTGSFTPVEHYPAPNIRFSDANGNIHNLTDYQGKVVLLNFWATWCTPCVAEMPTLSQLASDMQGRDVVVLPISVDFSGSEAVQKFYNNNGIENLGVFVDNKGTAFKEYKLNALPTTFIIDRRGNVTTKIMGAMDWASDEVKAYLSDLGR